MALNVTRQAGQACSTRQTTSARLAQYRSARSVSFVCQAQQSSSHDVSISRREIFLASVLPMAAAAGLVNPALALADGEEGKAEAPYGVGAKQTPRTFRIITGHHTQGCAETCRGSVLPSGRKLHAQTLLWTGGMHTTVRKYTCMLLRCPPSPIIHANPSPKQYTIKHGVS